MKPEQIELICYRLERARESMDEARLLLNNGHLNTCVNRLYYININLKRIGIININLKRMGIIP